MTNKVQAKRNNSKQSHSNGSVEQYTHEVSYEGMLPIASELEKYENLSPGLTERLLIMVEERHKHVMEMEVEEAKQNADVNEKTHAINTKMVRNSWLEVIFKYLFGGLFGSGLLYCGFYAMNHGHDNVAIAIFAGGFLTAASKFISSVFTKDKSKNE